MNSSFPPRLSGEQTATMTAAPSSGVEDLAGLVLPVLGDTETKLLASRISPHPAPSGKRFSYQGYTVPTWN